MEDHICEYGCGRKAVHFFKYVKKWCCSKNQSQCPVVKEKLKQTNLRRFGGHPAKTKEVKNKKKRTCQKRYGVDSAFKIPGVDNKKKKTCLKNYGVEYPSQSPIIRERMKDTIFERYGVEHPAFSPEITEKKKQTCLKKYGVEYAVQIEEVIEKKKKTFLKKYGFEHPSRSEKVRRKIRLASIKRIEERRNNGEQLIPNYNPIACNLIDEYGNKYGYNFIHAMNGGEYHIKELGYWVDGYDSEKNTVVEVDEPSHYDNEGNLLERDVRRQNEIINFLNCDFIRMKLDKDNSVVAISRLKD